jgi:hypothetical protein
MVPWKKTLIAALAATIIGAGAMGAALAASGRHSGNDLRVHTPRPAVLDSHGSGTSDDGNGLGRQGESLEAGDDNGHEVEAGDDNSNSGPSDNQGPGENSGSEDDGGNSRHDGGGDDRESHGGNSGSDG